MRKIKFILIFFLIFNFEAKLNSSSIKIKVKIQDEIITNIDIKNEKKYLIFLNPKLENLDKVRTDKIAKDSLINEIIKKNELKKFFDFEETKNIVDKFEKNIFLKKNVNNKKDFIKILNQSNLDYKTIRNKLHIEALWNQLIYTKYYKNIKIDRKNLRENILNQYQDKKKIYEYNLSEIVFKETIDKNSDELFKIISKNINEIGFENTANIFSISNTSKDGGLIGWVNEFQVSGKINNQIKDLEINNISKPIKIQNGYILIKVNDKKELKQNINIDEQLNRLENEEKNRQLNNFSIIFFKKLRKNLEIYEY